MSESVTQLRLSEINLDRLNKALLQLNQQMQGLAARLDKLEATAKSTTSAGKPGYPGIENGSVAIIQGPPPGGPLPLQPWIDDHSLVIGEGSKPMKWIKGTDGQVPIGCTGDDPKFGNIKGDGTPTTPGRAFGISVEDGCNSITLALNASVEAWIILVSVILAISPPG